MEPIHDLKTLRSECSPGLPKALMIVPLAFYAGIVISLGLSAFFILSANSADKETVEWKSRESAANSEQSKFKNSSQDIKSVMAKARGVAEWLEACRPLQPLTAATGRSISPDSTIAKMSLDRNPEVPANTALKLELNGDRTSELDSAITTLNGLNYQTRSVQQAKAKSVTNFSTVLVYNEGN